jgi:RimJ/RimL family protein N-acetyltransferase
MTDRPAALIGMRASTPADDAAQAAWVASAEEVERFAGPTLRFPVTSDQLQLHRDDPAITTFTAFVPPDEATAVGRVDVVALSPTTARLSRMVIDPARRGQGLASVIVSAALRWARAEAGFREVELHVFRDNVWAIRAYERAGFTTREPHADDERQYTLRCLLG